MDRFAREEVDCLSDDKTGVGKVAGSLADDPGSDISVEGVEVRLDLALSDFTVDGVELVLGNPVGPGVGRVIGADEDMGVGVVPTVGQANGAKAGVALAASERCASVVVEEGSIAPRA